MKIINHVINAIKKISRSTAQIFIPSLYLAVPVLSVVCVQIQMLSSFEEKMKDVQTVDISQYVAARGTLPGKSAADSIAVNLRQDRPVVASASTDTAVRTDQTEGCTYNALCAQFWHCFVCKTM